MASFGEELKRERELRDISLKEISEATKISIRFLEALEQNNFDILPGGIFNRGFIRAYARFIGIDGEEMVNAYLHEVALKEARQSQRAAGGGAARPVPSRSAGPAPEARPTARPERRSAPRPTPPSALSGLEGRTSLVLWIMAAIAFVIGAVVIVMSLMGSGRVSAGAGEPAASTPGVPSTATNAPLPPEPLVAGLGEKQEPDPFADTGPRPAVPPDSGTGGSEPPATGQTTARTPDETAPASPDAEKPREETQDAAAEESDSADPPVPRHRVRVLATETTVVTIRCADQVVLDQELWPGQTRTFTCEEPVLLAADNGGAVQYSIDGGPSALLGGLGEKIEGLVVAPPPEPTTPAGPGGPRAGN